MNAYSVSHIGYLGETIKIKAYLESGDSYWTYKYDWNNGSKIVTNTTHRKDEEEVSISIPENYAQYIPNADSGYLKVYFYAYDSKGKSTGSGSTSVTLKVSKNTKPTVSLSYAETVSGIAEQFGAYVQGKSKIKVTITANGIYGSTIKKYGSSINGVVYTSNTFTTGVIKGSGTETCITNVVDSRGMGQTTSKDFTVLPYTKPKINTFTISRCLEDGTLDDEGTFVKVISNVIIDSVSNKNTKSFKLYHKLTSSSTWQEIDLTGNSYTLNDERILSGFDIDNTYNFKIEATDFFETRSLILNLPTSSTILDFLANGKGMAVGKGAEFEDIFDIGYPMTYMSKRLHMGGNKLSDEEKSIFFFNTQKGNFPHKSKIYGGNGESEIAIGCYDNERAIRVWAYYDAGGKFVVSDELDFYHGSQKVATNGDWIDAKLTSYFKNYQDLVEQRPRYKKIGDMVCVSGVVTPTQILAGSSDLIEIFTLPEGYRPTLASKIFVCQGSGMNRWSLTINTLGEVCFSRYGITDFVDCPTGTWLPFTVTFMI